VVPVLPSQYCGHLDTLTILRRCGRQTVAPGNYDEVAEQISRNPCGPQREQAMGARQSDSSEQRAAEEMIRAQVAAYLGKELTPATLKLERGAAVQVDGADEDESAFVEIFAHQGGLKGGQRHKVATDALKLITIARTRPNADLVIAFADEKAASYSTNGTWLSEALATWGIKVLVVQLDEGARDGIRAAQVRQRMVNPEAPAPPDAALDGR
jgi:hypothetical protein